MLTLMLAATDNEPEIVLNLEHSLVSLSKWEAEQRKSFFHQEEITHEGTLSYIRAMLLHDEPAGDWTNRLEVEHYKIITEYINTNFTATWFRQDPKSPPREVVTTELIYYWMIQLQIPFQPCETWHFSRLSTLIEVCGRKQSKPKKMSPDALRAQMSQLNAERREKLGTAG